MLMAMWKEEGRQSGARGEDLQAEVASVYWVLAAGPFLGLGHPVLLAGNQPSLHPP